MRTPIFVSLLVVLLLAVAVAVVPSVMVVGQTIPPMPYTPMPTPLTPYPTPTYDPDACHKEWCAPPLPPPHPTETPPLTPYPTATPGGCTMPGCYEPTAVVTIPVGVDPFPTSDVLPAQPGLPRANFLVFCPITAQAVQPEQ